jgi:Predicted transcriptional regulator
MPATSPSVFLRHLSVLEIRRHLSAVERAFDLRHAGPLLKQVIELPDGTRYFSIAQMVRRPVAPHPQPQPRFAIGLGCEIRHAARLVYAAGRSRQGGGHADRRQLPALRTRNCSQRAEPPITRTLILDENTRRVSSFAFSNAREL